MSNGFEPAVIPIVEVERVITDFEKVELGQWYWVKNDDDEMKPNLRCVMEVGSNYVKLQSPESRNGYSYCRIHRDDFNDELTFEPQADQHIQRMVNHWQQALADNMARIQNLTESLGIAPQIGHQSGNGEGKSLALLSAQVDVEQFKKALILAKEETLPELFKQNGKLSEELARWMGAPGLPMKAKFGPMKSSVDNIEDRLFNIQLYSGILETIFTLSEGAPASRDEKLRIMQRRLYMDEECLLAYELGGMEFKDIREFDKWLAKPENRDRILPFQRCMVSMRVRRDGKDRSHLNLNAFVKFGLSKADKFTYLIVRNGEQLYRVCTEQDFGEHMFPERATFDPTEPLMMKVRFEKVESMMSKREFDSIIEAKEHRAALREKWQQDNPREVWESNNPTLDWHYYNPYREGHSDFYHSDWQPFDDSSSFTIRVWRKSRLKSRNTTEWHWSSKACLTGRIRSYPIRQYRCGDPHPLGLPSNSSTTIRWSFTGVKHPTFRLTSRRVMPLLARAVFSLARITCGPCARPSGKIIKMQTTGGYLNGEGLNTRCFDPMAILGRAACL